MSQRRVHRLDRNHNEVRKAVEALGYLWLDCSQTNLGIDAIAVRGGQVRFIEVKDGQKPPSAQKLTPREAYVHSALKYHGVTVEIVTGLDASLDVLRERSRNFYGKEAGEHNV